MKPLHRLCPPGLIASVKVQTRSGEQSASFGKDAARYGTAALGQISKETEQRPLIAVAVALGVGVLLGMALGGRSS